MPTAKLGVVVKSREEVATRIIELFKKQPHPGHSDHRQLLESLINDGLSFDHLLPGTYLAFFRGDEIVVSKSDIEQLESELDLKLCNHEIDGGQALKLPAEVIAIVHSELNEVMNSIPWFTK